MDIFRELGLPVIDWDVIDRGANNQSSPKFDEGKFFSGLRPNTQVIDSQIHLLIGFEASTSLDRYSPYRCLRQSLHAEKSFFVLLEQYIERLFQL
jgi:hypothetical protein